MHLKFLFFICTLNGSIYILYDNGNANYCVHRLASDYFSGYDLETLTWLHLFVSTYFVPYRLMVMIIFYMVTSLRVRFYHLN